MVNFTYYAPTKVLFGKDTEKEVGGLLEEAGAKKVLLLYGGGSVRRQGLLQGIEKTLQEADISFVSLGEVVPNPLLSKVYEGIELCRAEGVDFILAVGGGSVIDTAKAIGYGVPAPCDVWDLFDGKAQPTACLPLGCVVTVAAAGSEMSRSAVITKDATGEKKGLGNDLARCKFAIMNPELTQSLPPYQTAVGVADILLHTMERYFTPNTTLEVTDEIAEGLMRAVLAAGRKVMRSPEDYDARAELLWAGALSHNGLTGAGGGHGDWACHQMGHELSGKYNLAHGASLTVLWASWARYVYKAWAPRFARFATHVLELEPQESEEETALLGIEEMEEYFWALELPTSLAEAELNPSEEEIEEMALRCTYYGKRTVGALQKLGQKEIAAIYHMACGG